MDLFIAFIIAMAIQFVMFIPAYFFQTDKLTDLSYGITFIILTLLFMQYSMPKLILAGMIILWAVRLIAYLFTRIHHMKKDARFDEMRQHLWQFMKFWILQGVAVFIIMLSALLYFSSGDGYDPSYNLVGVVIFALGLVIETIADYQKYQFKKDPKNSKRWMGEGLWRYSRHPNYLGEILCWVGIYVFVYPGLVGTDKFIALASPLFIILLLLFVSGIPLLERKDAVKYRKDKKYQEYKKNTGILLPYPTLLLAIIICLAAGGIGGFFTTTGPGTWYASIVKPSFNPPSWVFGPVWTTLYLMMGVSLYLAMKKKVGKTALVVFATQLVLNALWSILFFGFESPRLALLCIALLWCSILACIILFYKKSRTAAYLLIPYLLWVSFASVLNAAIYLLN
jgi:steroid 5-alpha reductase family enzyme/tryptophan-rich sensory protein